MRRILTSLVICRPPLEALLLSVILAVGTTADAAVRHNFRTMTWQDGVSSPVSCIFSEDKGFVWVGTTDGLFRFDGISVRAYTAEENSRHSLPSGEILQVVRDSMANVWVVTTGGAVRYQPESDNFERPHFEPAEFAGTVRSACAVSDGVLFGTQNRLYKYDYATCKIRLYARFQTDLTPYFIIERLAPLEDGGVLCFNRRNGILVITPKDDGVDFISSPFPCDRKNSGMLVDSQERVWVSPYNRGVECYDVSGTLLAAYNTENSALDSDIILCMCEHDGKIWLGTDGGGINVLDTETGALSSLKHISGDSNSLPDNTINALHFDSCGNTWAGSVKNGLCVVQKVGLGFYSDCPFGETRGLSEKSVNCIYQDAYDKSIWLGTDGEGVNRYNPADDSFTHYPETHKMQVTSLTNLSPSQLLVSTFSQGLFIFEKRGGLLTPLNLKNEDLNEQMHYSGKAVNLMREDDNSILLLADSLYRYHRRNGKVDKLYVPESHTGSLQGIGGRNGRSWLYDIQSIYEMGTDSDSAKTVLGFEADTVINSVSLGDDGTFWIASNLGLVSYDPEVGCRTHLPTTLFRSANSAVCDLKGRVWIGTDNGLFAYLPSTDRFMILDESDGAVPNAYKTKPRLCATDGTVYLGGTKGLLRVESDFEIEEQEDFDIMLTDVEVDGQRVNGRFSGGMLKVSHRSKLVKIRVLSREDNIFRKRMYRFTINGLYDEPVETYSPELELRSPAHGTYEVFVSCITADGRWLPESRLLILRVGQALYRTWWFWTLLALVVMGLGYVLVSRRAAATGSEAETGQTNAARDNPLEEEGLSPDEIFIRRLDILIETNIENPDLDVTFICQEMCMSRTAMFNRLKATTGANIKDYINKVRMEKAVVLVRDTKLTFSEISEKVGFSTARYFSTAFKNYFGMSPSECRSEHKK